MSHSFKAVSLSFRKAPLAIRELLALDEAACRRFVQQLRTEFHLADVLVLSTCNRTEIYYAHDDDFSAAIIRALGELKNRPDTLSFAPYFDLYTEAEAATRHLFEVALGLDAQVVGDMQIISQVKQAYQWTADADAAGPFLHRLLHTIFFANKRVQQETSFRDGAASMSYAALELVEELTADVANPRVLVVGLGEIGSDVCRHLADSKSFTSVTLCNRTRARAEELAAEFAPGRLRIVDFENLAVALRDADVVISSISRDTPFFTRDLVAHLDVLSYKFFIDLAVPRSVGCRCRAGARRAGLQRRCYSEQSFGCVRNALGGGAASAGAHHRKPARLCRLEPRNARVAPHSAHEGWPRANAPARTRPLSEKSNPGRSETVG